MLWIRADVFDVTRANDASGAGAPIVKYAADGLAVVAVHVCVLSSAHSEDAGAGSPRREYDAPVQESMPSRTSVTGNVDGVGATASACVHCASVNTEASATGYGLQTILFPLGYR